MRGGRMIVNPVRYGKSAPKQVSVSGFGYVDYCWYMQNGKCVTNNGTSGPILVDAGTIFALQVSSEKYPTNAIRLSYSKNLQVLRAVDA